MTLLASTNNIPTARYFVAVGYIVYNAANANNPKINPSNFILLYLQ